MFSDILNKLQSIPYAALVGAIVMVLTGVQAIAMFFATIFGMFTGSAKALAIDAFFTRVANAVGSIATATQQVLSWLQSRRQVAMVRRVALRKATTTVACVFFFGCIVASAFLVACLSFLHFSDPGAQSFTCALTETEIAQAEAQAAEYCGPLAPLCVDALEILAGDECSSVAAKGGSEADAHGAGLAAMKAANMETIRERAAMKAAEHDAGAP
jgi:hypothetical protein